MSSSVPSSVPAHLGEDLSPDRRAAVELLLEVTQLPTAAGREQRVVAFIERWAAARSDLTLSADPAGNLTISMADADAAPAPPAADDAPGPIYITAHLDHPAFVVEQLSDDQNVVLSFRGGVNAVYFENARVSIYPEGSTEPIGATLAGETPPPHGSPAGAPAEGQPPIFKHYLAKLDDAASALRVGDVATWELPTAEVDEQGIVHTTGCDDLAAVAAALATMDALRARKAERQSIADVRLLFTRAEEIGFIGAIGACKHRTMPRGARVIALENSRAFADSPIGGGPIVRVGDRMSVFSPQLTAACVKRAEELFGTDAPPRRATHTVRDLAGRAWQRKLMAGGACEATVFCSYGYTATCLCLPLGNYHNMAHLDAVQAGTYDAARLGPPRVGREYIALSDYFGLIDLLAALGENLPDTDPALPRLEELYESRRFVLE